MIQRAACIINDTRNFSFFKYSVLMSELLRETWWAFTPGILKKPCKCDHFVLILGEVNLVRQPLRAVIVLQC